MPLLETILTTLLSAIVGGGIGATLTHWLTRRREAEKRQKEKTLDYRVEAWRDIADQTGRKISADKFEKAMADVILFGNEKEIQLASKIMDDFVAENAADTTELVKELRRNIRNELGLEKTTIEFRWLRIGKAKVRR